MYEHAVIHSWNFPLIIISCHMSSFSSSPAASLSARQQRLMGSPPGMVSNPAVQLSCCSENLSTRLGLGLGLPKAGAEGQARSRNTEDKLMDADAVINWVCFPSSVQRTEQQDDRSHQDKPWTRLLCSTWARSKSHLPCICSLQVIS